MRFYDYNPENAPKLVIKIEAELKNLTQEEKALKAVSEFKYSGNVFNKRYETQLNKYLGDKFGWIELDSTNWKGEDRYGKVYAYMHDEITISEKRYSLNVYFTGYEVRHDYDTKVDSIGEKRGESYNFYSIHNADEITEWALRRLESIEESRDKLKKAKRQVNALIKEHNDIRQKLETFNDKVPYILSDELRIR